MVEVFILEVLKNKMINSTRVAYEFDSLLPVHMRPESTEGYEGFNHLHAIQGTCEETTMDYNNSKS